MAQLTIMPAKNRPPKCPAEDYKTIRKAGEITVPAATAMEAVRNSNGGYVIKPKAAEIEVRAGVALKIEEMDNEQLKLVILAAGKRIGPKKIKRSQLIELAARCVAESVQVIGDDDEVDGGDPDDDGADEKTEETAGADEANTEPGDK